MRKREMGVAATLACIVLTTGLLHCESDDTKFVDTYPTDAAADTGAADSGGGDTASDVGAADTTAQ